MTHGSKFFKYRHWDSRDGIEESTGHEVQIIVDGEIIDNARFYGGDYSVKKHIITSIENHISGKLRARNKSKKLHKHNAMLVNNYET